jgi:hypothetical protein
MQQALRVGELPDSGVGELLDGISPQVGELHDR